MLLTFLAGILGSNALPHFLRGITKRRYPTVFGDGPVTNVMIGWSGLVMAALLLLWARPADHPGWTIAAGAVGVLLIALFHAGPGAFGRRERTGS